MDYQKARHEMGELPIGTMLGLVRDTKKFGTIERNMIVDFLERLLEAARGLSAPIPMLLHCPECGTRHIDEGEFATKNHHTHACQECGFVWRPAIVSTVGVRFLPGFKNGDGR